MSCMSLTWLNLQHDVNHVSSVVKKIKTIIDFKEKPRV